MKLFFWCRKSWLDVLVTIFFCITFSFPLQHYQPCYAKKKKKKKIFITLNAFEDEQFNYKAEVRCDPRVVPGP